MSNEYGKFQPEFEPTCGGANWLWNNGPKKLPMPPESPVLSFIELNFILGCDIQDYSTSTGRLWLATLDYIRCLPDCTSACYGTVTEDRNTVIVLLQWKNGRAWSSFQRSMGFNMIRHVLAGPPHNRAALCHIRTVEKVQQCRILSFYFQGPVTAASKDNFDKLWHAWTSDLERCGLAKCYGGWLEPDGPGNIYLRDEATSQYFDACLARQQFVFIGILYSRKQAQAAAEIVASNPSLNAQETELHALTETAVLQRNVTFRALESGSRPASKLSGGSGPSDGMRFLLGIRPRCHFHQCFSNCYPDTEAESSMIAVRNGEREFVKPCGGYRLMGELNQYGTFPPPFRFTETLKIFSSPIQHFELYWIQLKAAVTSPESTTEPAMQAFLNVRLEVMGRKNIKDVRYGVDHQDNSLMVMLVYRKDDFVDGEVLVPQDLWNPLLPWVTQISPALRCSTQGKPHHPYEKLLEITSYRVALDGSFDHTRSSFLGSYLDFECTTRAMILNVPSGPPPIQSPCWPLGGGWHESCTASGNTKPVRSPEIFTAFIAWASVTSREQWYQEYAEGMDRSYEHFGGVIDALRCWIKGEDHNREENVYSCGSDVTTRLVKMERMVYEEILLRIQLDRGWF